MLTRGEDFDEFVRGSSTRLLRTAVLLTGDRGAAEDLVQTVYERVYLRWRWVRGAPEAYARRALVNHVANRWRGRARRPEVALAEWHQPQVSDASQLHADRDELVRALQQLPPRQRAVLVLRYFEDLTEAQTAELMGCSVGTVKSQSSRALTALRQHLTPATVEGSR